MKVLRFCVFINLYAKIIKIIGNTKKSTAFFRIFTLFLHCAGDFLACVGDESAVVETTTHKEGGGRKVVGGRKVGNKKKEDHG